MFYSWDITVPADTPESAPLMQFLPLTKGVITNVNIRFPAGCHGLVKIRLLRFEHALEPLNRDDWITGDDEPINISEFYELKESPARLKFVGYSEGSFYPHVITVRVTVLPKNIASLVPVIDLLSKMMQRLGFL